MAGGGGDLAFELGVRRCIACVVIDPRAPCDPTGEVCAWWFVLGFFFLYLLFRRLNSNRPECVGVRNLSLTSLRDA